MAFVDFVEQQIRRWQGDDFAEVSPFSQNSRDWPSNVKFVKLPKCAGGRSRGNQRLLLCRICRVNSHSCNSLPHAVPHNLSGCGDAICQVCELIAKSYVRSFASHVVIVILTMLLHRSIAAHVNTVFGPRHIDKTKCVLRNYEAYLEMLDVDSVRTAVA